MEITIIFTFVFVTRFARRYGHHTLSHSDTCGLRFPNTQGRHLKTCSHHFRTQSHSKMGTSNTTRYTNQREIVLTKFLIAQRLVHSPSSQCFNWTVRPQPQARLELNVATGIVRATGLVDIRTYNRLAGQPCATWRQAAQVL